MSGLFEHLAATDNTARVAARKAVAVAHKRVSDRVDSFIKSATSVMDFNSRVSLVDDDVRRIVSEVVAEYGGDAETIYNSITAGWEDLTRGPDGKWSTPSSDDSSDESEDSDLDSELADAPSAVGEGTTAQVRPFHGAEAPSGVGGSVERVDLPKGNKDAQDGPSPKIDKGKAGDEKAHKPSTVDSEGSKSRNPTDSQKVTDGRDDVLKGTSDRKYEDVTPHSKGTLKSEDLPSADDWAGFADGGVAHGPNTKTFPKGNQADPVTSKQGAGAWGDDHGLTGLEDTNAESANGLPGAPYVEEMQAPIECPQCHGFDPACPTCHGDRGITTDVPGHDGTITPHAIDPNQLQHADMGSFPKYQGGVDPDKNPIVENLNAWTDEQHVQQAIASFERQSLSPVPGDVDPNDDPGYQQFKQDLGQHHYDQKGDSYEPCPDCGTPSQRGVPQCETCGSPKPLPPSAGGDWINPEESDPTYGEY